MSRRPMWKIISVKEHLITTYKQQLDKGHLIRKWYKECRGSECHITTVQVFFLLHFKIVIMTYANHIHSLWCKQISLLLNTLVTSKLYY